MQLFDAKVKIVLDNYLKKCLYKKINSGIVEMMRYGFYESLETSKNRFL